MAAAVRIEGVPRAARAAMAREGRGPFLANRARPRMGDPAGVGSFLLGLVSDGVGVIADIVRVPADLLTRGVGAVSERVAGVIWEIPVLGELVAQILLAINAVTAFALPVPTGLLSGIANVFENLSNALDSGTSGAADRGRKVQAARGNIIESAPPELRREVQGLIERTPAPAGPRPSLLLA